MSKDDTVRATVKEHAALYRDAELGQDAIALERSKHVMHVTDALSLDSESVERKKDLNSVLIKKKKK